MEIEEERIVVRMACSNMENQITKIDWNDNLPVELWYDIFTWLDVYHLTILSGICKYWQMIVQDEQLWQHLYKRDFKGIDVYTLTHYKNSYRTLCKEIAFFPPVGSKCLAEWLDEDYYSGTIKRIVESHDWLITFPGGGNKWIPSCSDMLPDISLFSELDSKTIEDKSDSDRPDKPGTKVLTLWRNDNEYTEAIILNGPSPEGLYEVELLDNQFFNHPVKLKRVLEELRKFPSIQETETWRDQLKVKSREELIGTKLTIEFMAAGLRGWMRGVVQDIGKAPYFQYHIQYDDGDLGWVRRDQVKRIFIPSTKIGVELNSIVKKKIGENDLKLKGRRVLVPATKGKNIYYPGRLSDTEEALSEIMCWLNFKNGKIFEDDSSFDDLSSGDDTDSDLNDEENIEILSSSEESEEEIEQEDEDTEIPMEIEEERNVKDSNAHRSADPSLIARLFSTYPFSRSTTNTDQANSTENQNISTIQTVTTTSSEGSWGCALCGTENATLGTRCRICNSIRVLQMLYIELERLKELGISSISKKKETDKEQFKFGHLENHEIRNFMRLVKRDRQRQDCNKIQRMYKIKLDASQHDLWAPRENLMEIPEDGATTVNVGDPVIAQWSKGFWYPGIVSIVGTNGNPGQMTIAFDTNDLIVVDQKSVVKRA